jgi:hypothetical protein
LHNDYISSTFSTSLISYVFGRLKLKMLVRDKMNGKTISWKERERKSKKYETFLLLLAGLNSECMSTFQKLLFSQQNYNYDSK